MGKKKNSIFLSLIVAISIFLIFQKVIAANVPLLKEGTFLSGQTLSVWPSWSTLGGAFGQALPVDPINQLAPAGTCATTTNRFCLNDSQCPNDEACILHDPMTGWSTANRRFSFACNADSYAYRYVVDPSTSKFTIRAHFEDTGLAPVNYNNFVRDFIDPSVVKINDGAGVCYANEEISTLETGRCGDGRLNLQQGEACDPPGRAQYEAGCTAPQGRKSLLVCNNTCQWTPSTTPCNAFSKCGNGRKEAGEICDEGSLNGKYNHCNLTCSGMSQLGNCGNGQIEAAYEVCDPGTPGREKYGEQDKARSCAWDCQNWGPYCGDNITQSQYGEECDGSSVCTIDGRPGTKVCTDTCKKQDQDALVWWSFEDLTDTGNQDKKMTEDITVHDHDAVCNGERCPEIQSGKIGKALEFNTRDEGKYLQVANQQDLDTKGNVTVEAWVKPTNNEGLYQRIVEHGGAETKTGYDLELNPAADKQTARFNVWNGNQNSIDSIASIPLNEWTHIVATFEKNNDTYTLKIYINGNLENTNNFTQTAAAMARPEGDLFIGKSNVDGGSNFLFGSLDEVKIYPRALSAAEVENNYQSGWFCAAGVTPPAPVDRPVSCGNNIVDVNEACDRGLANNGQPCTASYNQPCSYCAADCQNVIDVQPLEYCGNGIIERNERCDVSAVDGIIYASVTNTSRTTSSTKDEAHNGYQELACSAEPYVSHVLKKGTKTCSNCLVGVVRNCVNCGQDANGVVISGGIVNVLATSSPEKDPLFTHELITSSLRLAVGTCNSFGQIIGNEPPKNVCAFPLQNSPAIGQSVKGQTASDLQQYTLQNPYAAGDARINSNPVCSTDADPAKKYLLYINNDWSRPWAFPVLAQPQSWQYDLVLSPVIPHILRNKDVRVVTTWVSGDFYSAVLNPFITTTPEISGALYCGQNCVPGQKKYATGIDYYNIPNADITGVWYNGFFNTSGRTEVESFTVNTANMSGNTYSFYVRAPNSPIRQFRNTARLKVDVYLPENDSNPYHFARPAKTYYFNTAAPSDNPNARYWHVFNINKPEAAAEIALGDIIDVNTIFTGPGNFVYFQPLVGESQRNTPPVNPADPNGNDQINPDSGSGSGNPAAPGPDLPPVGGANPDNGGGGQPPAAPIPGPGLPPMGFDQ